jgi:hypothetical protein
MMSGTAGSNDRMLELMRKAMTLGIEDSRLKEAIVTTLPASISAMGGRTGNLANMSNIMSMAGNAALAGGRTMDQRDISVAAQAVDYNSRLTSGASGIGPIDVRMTNKTMAVARKMGLPADVGWALSTLGNKDLVMSEMTKDLLSSGGITDPKKQQAVLDAIRMGRANVADDTLKGMSSRQAVRDVALSQNDQVPYDVVKQSRNAGKYQDASAFEKWIEGKKDVLRATGTGTGPRFPNPLMDLFRPLDEGANPMSSGVEGLLGTNRSIARTQGAPTQAGFTDEKMQANLGNAVLVGEKFVGMLERMDKMGNLDHLQSVPKLVDDLATSIEHLGTATATATGQKLRVPDRTGTAPGPGGATGGGKFK